jgi:hypothetical protein
MPKASLEDDDLPGLSSPGADSDIVGDDDDGVVEVNEDGTPVQDREVTSGADDGDEPDDDADDDAGTDDDRARLETKRKREAQRENAKLKRRLAEMEDKLSSLEQGYGSIREAETARLRDTVAEYVSAAEQALEAALEDGDAKGIVAAQRELHRVQAEAERWEDEADQAPPPAARASAAPNPLVDRFIDKHSTWFDPKGRDVDSSIVVRLSAEIAKEGIAPDSRQHFAELEQRMARYLPHRVGGSRSKPRPSAAAPSSAGAGDARPGTGKGIPIFKSTIAGFKELGIDWDDPDPVARKAARTKITQRVVEAKRNRGDTA